jgi:hypothetical protein
MMKICGMSSEIKTKKPVPIEEVQASTRAIRYKKIK